MQASTCLKSPSRIYQALLPNTSSATPGQMTRVPGRWFFSINSLTAIAPKMITACPELCPSPCPGAPSTMGDLYATPGFCEALGMQSRSLPSAITGLPLPQRATQAVGIPDTPRSTVKPFFSSTPVRYLEVSYSWKPSSPKLNTMSTISCTDLALLSTEVRAWSFRFLTNAESYRPADWPWAAERPIRNKKDRSALWAGLGEELLMCAVVSSKIAKILFRS